MKTSLRRWTLSAPLLVMAFFVTVDPVFGQGTGAAVKPAREKIQLKVLYAGLPGTERAQDFVSFLSRHFSKVETSDVLEFQEGQTEGFDVVIVDKDGIQWGGRGGKPLSQIVNFSDTYSRATIALGIPGAFLFDRKKLKLGYR